MLKTWDLAYAPKDLLNGEFIWANPRNERKIRLFTERKLFAHLLLYGPPGTGKTTILRLLPDAILDGKTRNAVHRFDARSDAEAERNYKDLIGLRKRSHWIDGDRLVVVINEVDDFKNARLNFLKNTLEDFERDEGLIPIQLLVSTNSLPDIPLAVKERFTRIEIKRPSMDQLVAHGKAILDKEGLSLPEEEIRDCVLYADYSPRVFLKKLCLKAWLAE